MQRIKLVLTCAMVFLITCKPRNFNSTKLLSSSNQELFFPNYLSQNQEKIAGRIGSNAFSFGIPFNAVQPSHAAEFWNSWKNSGSLSSRLQKSENVKITTSEISLSPSNLQTLLEPSRIFVHIASDWIKTSCLLVDMTSAQEKGTLLFYGWIPNVGPAASPTRKCRFFSETDNAVTDLTPDEFLNAKLEIDTSDKPDAFGKLPFRAAIGQPLEGISQIEVTIKPVLVVGNKRYRSENMDLALRLVGNTFVPRSTYGVSKTFAVPAMHFDQGKPQFLDFGELLIHGMPEEKNVLVTGQSPIVIESMKSGQFSKMGLYFQNLPKDLNNFLRFPEMPEKTRQNSPMYHRLPAGSFHMVLNATVDSYFDKSGFVLADISRSDLLSLYRNSGMWVNVYDQAQVSNYAIDWDSRSWVYKSLSDKSCIGMPTQDYPLGMVLKHEVILGGKLGREFIINHPTTLYLEKCPEPIKLQENAK